MQTQTQDDEIDLMALFFRLWQQKKLIALITISFGLLALLATFVQSSKWTTQAQVVVSKDFEIATALKRQIDYNTIVNQEPDKDAPTLNQTLYDTFLSELRSRDTRVDFFRQSELFKKLSEGKGEAQQAAILRSLVTKQMTVEWPDEKKNINFPTISFTAANPQDAQKTLAQYLQYLNTQVMHLNDKDFQLMVQNKVDTLKHQKQMMEANLSNAQKIKLENLSRALMAAQKAGIQEYARSQAGKGGASVIALGDAEIQLTDDQMSNNSFLFLLGQKYLQAQINSIQDTDLTFPLQYYVIQQQLPLLEKLLTPKDSALTDQGFHYQSAPFLPLEKDNPSRILVTLLGLIMGFMLGSIYVLFKTAATTYRLREATAASTEIDGA